MSLITEEKRVHLKAGALTHGTITHFCQVLFVSHSRTLLSAQAPRNLGTPLLSFPAPSFPDEVQANIKSLSQLQLTSKSNSCKMRLDSMILKASSN